ncbi:sugar ABC transporter permease [Micromonospora craniellae]|uniref:Sugar ABC transporter permease n=1 Tax=Micromonospora craniellae TaxID=2294034 RepID=A0A372FS46_9ACTN|nr:sugar ABC transporter permease [Micromonospora craniellae]QOC91592.1 sugar ABC transporter permease [Micromonospora craniellae]RFS43528.1 sugar ABC transporter permease [Micromonospora craniellae]
MTSPVLSVTTPSTRLGTGARVGIGLVLLLPAFLALLWSYLLPTGLAISRSTTRDNLLGPPTDVGAEHYRQRFEQGVVGEYRMTLLVALVPLVLALVVAPLLALLADQAGRRSRLAARALLAVPVAGYAPVALILAWRLDRIEPGQALDRPYATLVELTAVGSAGLVVAVATTAFLATLRGRRRPADALPAAATVAGLLVLGIVAATLQSFVAPLLAASNRAPFPLTTIVVQSLARMDVGRGSADAVLLLAVLAVLGLAATTLLLVTRARIELADTPARYPITSAPAATAAPAWPASDASTPPHSTAALAWPASTPPDAATSGDSGPTSEGSGPARIGLAVAGLVAVGLMLWVAWPWLSRSFRFTSDLGPASTTGLPELLIWTWLPTLVTTIVTIGVAVAGGFAIGGLRPLGRFSELLLLPFAPWLFVGTGPLAIESYLRTRDLDQVNTFLGVMPPGWVSIPALFLFTLLFRGLEPGWRAGGGFGGTMLAPAAPMVLLAGLVTWLVSSGQLLWPWIVGQTPGTRTAPVEAMAQGTTGRISADELALGAVLPLPLLLLFLVALVALQMRYLDRLAIRVGRAPERAEHP